MCAQVTVLNRINIFGKGVFIMKQLKKILSAMFVLAFVMGMFSGSIVKVQAGENKNFLPDGWASIGFDELSKVQQENIKNTIQLRGPAPALTSLQIIDLAVDDYNEIHVVTKEIGTSKSNFVWVNGSLCSENHNAREPLWGTNNIAYGFIRYYHTGIIYTNAVKGNTLNVKASSDNAMGQYYTLSDAVSFVIP